MKSKLEVGVSLSALAGVIASFTAAAPARAEETPQATTTAQVEEVIVTAVRRETSLQRTAEAVSVLNGATQRERGEQRLENLQTNVPNVSFSSTSNTSQLYVRGIGNTFIIAGGDPGVAMYQDGAYVSDTTSNNTSMFDVARVEVLRGPQGALYGRNAVGGAINIISAAPTSSWQGRIDGVVGDDGRRESEGYVSGPLGVADTDVRLSYQLRALDGYTKNLLKGQPGAPGRLDDLKSQAIRFQTLTRLPTAGELRVIASYFHESDNGAALGVKPTPGFLYPAEAIFGATPAADPRRTQANVGSNKLEVASFNASYVQPVGDNVLTVLGAYRDAEQTYLNDCDGTSALACSYYRHTTSQDYYGDIHLASSDDSRLRWLVGATYLQFNQSQLNQVSFLSRLPYFVPGAAANLPFPVNTAVGGRVRTEALAAYADVRYALNDIWAVTGQIRYGETDKRALENSVFPEFGVFLYGVPTNADTNSTPFRVGIEGQLKPNLFVYAKYGTAVKDAAINLGAAQAAPVRSEEVKSAEFGWKSSWLEQRLQINGALFHSNYTQLQISQLVDIQVGLANAPKARIQGAELEIVAAPAAGLRLTLNGGYLKPTFRKFTNGRTIPGPVGSPVENLRGNDLPYVPRWTVNLGFNYSAPPIAGLTPGFDVQYAWRDRVYFSEFNDKGNSQKPVGLLNIAASLAPENGPWRVYGFVHNVTDETVISGTTVYAGILGAEKAVSYTPPRNFGIGVALTF
ncbi:MAG: TonB-dependent receptor [Phenylobacterium sp.]|uniref:TonB-dependent receptor n=1 Tax=Phenylobacterium sp. TaxID=1871053 RepID=UPI001215A6DE|nr:TonB-dependent receptor [Phenylobacterium sp.]TAJ71866.1 MAG: TonB-dependent receptor [Phenylobacterium sp.]